MLFKRDSFFVRYMKRGFWCSALYFVCIVPLAYVLPPQIGWENGILENVQVVVLFLGGVLNFYFFRCAHRLKINIRKQASGAVRGNEMMWLTISYLFFLLTARELSWGRVFFPIGMTDAGPVLVRMNQVPYHEIISVAIALSIIAIAASMLFAFPWRRLLFEVPFPGRYVVLTLASVALAHIGEHTALFSELEGQLVEEMAELLVYLWMVILSAYYWRLRDLWNG